MEQLAQLSTDTQLLLALDNKHSSNGAFLIELPTTMISTTVRLKAVREVANRTRTLRTVSSAKPKHGTPDGTFQNLLHEAAEKWREKPEGDWPQQYI